MSDKQNNDFAARLARIEGKSGVRPTAQPTQPRLDYDDGPLIKSAGSNHLVRNTLIWTLILGVLGAGGYYGAREMVGAENLTLAKLSEGFGDLAEAAQSMGPNGTVNIAQIGRAEQDVSPRRLRDRGYIYNTPLIATPDNVLTDVSQIVAGYTPTTDATAPRAILPFDTNTTCTLRRPQEDETVTNVRLDFGIAQGPVQIFSHEMLGNAVARNISGYVTRHKPKSALEARVDGHAKVVNVVLTDTSAPQYVVLQTLQDDVVWNLHPAPGVTIAHVAMIGNNSGLVDMPDMPSFEALRVSDFVEDHEYGNDDEIRDCMIRPWRSPQPHWDAVLKSKGDNMLMINQVYTYTMGHKAFNSWYTQTLGVDADTNLTAAEGAASVLAGPLPATPVAFQDMTGRDIHMTRTDFVITGSQAARMAEIEKMQMDLVTAASGGDLALLTPPLMGIQP